MKTKIDKRSKNMNRKKIISTTSKQTQLMAVAIIAASVIAAAMIVGINNNGQNLQKVMAQQVYPSGTSKTETAKTSNEYKTAPAAASSSTNAAVTVVKAVSPNQSTSKEFWINTVHLDGMTNINAGVKCDTCPQNTPTHPQSSLL
jgi:acetyl/propionyl-CoA carboxylase alpha subunit